MRNSINSENEWGSLKEIIVGSVPKKYLIPTVKSRPFTKEDIKLIQKSSEKVFPKNYNQQVKMPIKGKADQNIAYDYRNMKVISSGNVNWIIDFLNDEIPLDPISSAFQIRRNLKKGIEQFGLHLIKLDEGTYNKNIFKVIGEEIIVIKDTKYPCRVLERTVEKGGKSLYYIAETLDFILVKVVDERKERKISIEAEKILSFG